MSETVPGGVWALTNSNAFLTGPLVNPLMSGIDTVLYRVHYSCGTATAQFPIAIVSPDAGIITGSHTVCAGDTITFSDSAPGGTWNIDDTTNAVIVTSGMVKAKIPGSNFITYTVTTGIPGCSASSTFPFHINPASACAPSGVANASTAGGEICVYPNPSTHAMFVEMAAINDTRQIIVSDLFGRTVFTTTIAPGVTRAELHIHVPAGTYILNIQDSNTTNVRKIVVE
jgi:hypothetical protein